MTPEEIADLIREYRAGAEESSSSMRTVDPQRANRGHDRLHAAYKVLRTTPEGRAAISALMHGPNPDVRGWAAAHSLFWAEEEARKVLEVLVQEGGLLGFEAQMVLQEFDEGRLTFDY